MKDIIGSILGIALAVILLGVTPLYYIGIIQWAKAETQVMAYTTNLVDEVIDTKQLTDATLEEYNLKMASVSNYYTYTIERQIKVTDPDPLGSDGDTYTTYVTVDDNRTYDSGDLIVVTVTPTKMNVAQSVASNMLGLTIPQSSFSIPARVR